MQIKLPKPILQEINANKFTRSALNKKNIILSGYHLFIAEMWINIPRLIRTKSNIMIIFMPRKMSKQKEKTTKYYYCYLLSRSIFLSVLRIPLCFPIKAHHQQNIAFIYLLNTELPFLFIRHPFIHSFSAPFSCILAFPAWPISPNNNNNKNTKGGFSFPKTLSFFALRLLLLVSHAHMNI